ncbi:PREDICTED: myeloid leukemia factor 1 [Lepidothrix coronata]|uniref:Myeloid leukemia factor 1 n=1 Tax=Lepidothrix coronata TaxID=321398 RepID=A0A6J0IJG5_9PASS|nr:PREDICTED: myeloid leukemia factor 1 [Lepidothrix coronata]
MFGGLGRCFEEDPFFRDPFAAHHEHMRQMMRSFSEPFGREPFPSLPEGRDRGERALERRARPDSRLAPRGTRRVRVPLPGERVPLPGEWAFPGKHGPGNLGAAVSPPSAMGITPLLAHPCQAELSSGCSLLSHTRYSTDKPNTSCLV